MKLPLHWVDAFTSHVFAGNPAAVVPLEAWLPDVRMQQIAFENGLAETAFFVRTAATRFNLRWFTPLVEVDLCGHATLAAAHVLFSSAERPTGFVTFDTRSGPLAVTRGAAGRIELDFPLTPVALETDPAVRARVAAALAVEPAWIGRSRFDLFAVLNDAGAVRALHPDLQAVASAGGRGLIVTAPGDATCDFVSRFFAPQSGVPEDPVTGSAHSALAPYWAARLGRRTLHARQVSRRGGELWCEVGEDLSDSGRVRIAGHAVGYLDGHITI